MLIKREATPISIRLLGLEGTYKMSYFDSSIKLSFFLSLLPFEERARPYLIQWTSHMRDKTAHDTTGCCQVSLGRN